MLLSVKEPMGVAPDGAEIDAAVDWEFRFAAEDRSDSKITAWATIVDEVLDGVFGFQ